MFLEYSFTLVGPRDYFALVIQFSKLQSHCKCLYLTLTPNPKPGLKWAPIHSLEEWMRFTHKKEIALNKYIARHHKLGSLQCRSSCPTISEKKEGLCQSPRELWVQWGIQHQATRCLSPKCNRRQDQISGARCERRQTTFCRHHHSTELQVLGQVPQRSFHLTKTAGRRRYMWF